MKEDILKLIKLKSEELEKIKTELEKADFPSDRERLRTELLAIGLYSTQLQNIIIKHNKD